MSPPIIRAEVRDPAADRFDIALSIPGARLALSDDEGEAFVVADGEMWLEAMRQLAAAHRDGVDALGAQGQADRLRRMLHIAMERSIVQGFTRERARAHAIAAALHQLAEFVSMEFVVSFQVSFSGGDEDPVVVAQFRTGPMMPIVLDLGVIDRAGTLA